LPEVNAVVVGVLNLTLASIAYGAHLERRASRVIGALFVVVV